MNVLGNIYATGKDVPKDINNAKRFYEKAISQGKFDQKNRPNYNKNGLVDAYNNLACLLSESNEIVDIINGSSK